MLSTGCVYVLRMYIIASHCQATASESQNELLAYTLNILVLSLSRCMKAR